ncbi:hypothetical protein DPMN_154662 [Dreissena polymorpha]|uniref:Uncharacterized protein n=1 Tax=Dreissena polymorpha TaxID=45954 RepID=A0A9D4JA54_DREPO|nr:hypothetical protein DPMN_154662 [Dreissena polymorpha]
MKFNSLRSVGKLMKLVVSNLLSMPITEVAMTIHIKNSAVLVSSLDRVALKYSKLVPSSRDFPLNVMPELVLSWTSALSFFLKLKSPLMP